MDALGWSQGSLFSYAGMEGPSYDTYSRTAGPAGQMDAEQVSGAGTDTELEKTGSSLEKEADPVEKTQERMRKRKEDREQLFDELEAQKKEEEARFLEQEKRRMEKEAEEKEREDAAIAELLQGQGMNPKKISGLVGIQLEGTRLGGVQQTAGSLLSGVTALQSEIAADRRMVGGAGAAVFSGQRLENLEGRYANARAEGIERSDRLLQNIQSVRKIRTTVAEQQEADKRPKTVYERAAAVAKSISNLQRAEQYGHLQVNTQF